MLGGILIVAAAAIPRDSGMFEKAAAGPYATYLPQEKSGPGWLIVAGIGLVVLVLLLLAAFPGASQKWRHDVRQQATTNGGTSGLKSLAYERYFNSRFGFSILYPKDFEAETRTTGTVAQKNCQALSI